MSQDYDQYKKELSIVIPVFNEEKNLLELHRQLVNVLDKITSSYEIIFIDDGSKDNSPVILRKIHENNSKVKVIYFRRNFGQTSAMAAGFNTAKGKIIISLDADLQNDPVDIPKLLSKMREGFDVVSGWRRNRKDKFFTKKLPSFFANKLISKITGVHLHDYGCTLKAYRKDVLENVNLYGEAHRFIPALASWMGIKVAEITVNHRKREYGKTNYGLLRTFHVILDLINVKFLLSYKTRPIQIFGGIGLFSIFLSFILGAIVIFLKIIQSFDISGNPLFLLASIFFLIGIQFIVLGLLGEITIRTYHESQGKPTYMIKKILEKNEREEIKNSDA